jgi:hypothetical protein
LAYTVSGFSPKLLGPDAFGTVAGQNIMAEIHSGKNYSPYGGLEAVRKTGKGGALIYP